MEETHYLYKITNLINGKLYIGVTKDPKHRKETHFSKGPRLVNRAYKKYGKDALTFEVICVGSKGYIYDLEVEAIKLYNSDATTGHGYNVCSGGFKGDAGNKGRKHRSKSDDIPYYVSGFWFPNKRTAVSSLNWGDGRFNSRKKLGVLGNECVLKSRYGPQSPIYARGFWFPNVSKAADSLNISNTGVLYKHRKLGTLGDECVPVKGSISSHPVYFKGFWFKSVDQAASIYNKKREAVMRSLRRGNVEECSSVKGIATVRYYSIDGTLFSSLTDAAAELSIPYNTLRQKFYSQSNGFQYVYQ